MSLFYVPQTGRFPNKEPQNTHLVRSGVVFEIQHLISLINGNVSEIDFEMKIRHGQTMHRRLSGFSPASF